MSLVLLHLTKLNKVCLKSSMLLFHTDIYTISCTGMFINIQSYHHISCSLIIVEVYLVVLVDLLKGIFAVEGVVVSLTANVSSED